MENKTSKRKSDSGFLVSILYDSNRDIKSNNKTKSTMGQIFYVLLDLSLIAIPLRLCIVYFAGISAEKFDKHFHHHARLEQRNSSPLFLTLLLPRASGDQGFDPTVYYWIHSTCLAYLASG